MTKAKVSIRHLTYRPVSDLKPNRINPRKHGRTQIQAIAKSIKEFGFNAPILIDKSDGVLAGHGTLEAAKRLGLAEVPVICLEDLTEPQARAYMIADNRLTDLSSFPGVRHDDQVDSTTQFLDHMRMRSEPLVISDEVLRRAAMPGPRTYFYGPRWFR